MRASVSASVKMILIILLTCTILIGTVVSIWYFIPTMTTDIAVCSDYSYGIGDPIWHNYEYSPPVDAQGNSLLNDDPGDFDECYINSKFVIITYKNDRMHYDMLRRHIMDQLVYLNNQTQTAEVLYECTGTNRIVYGNMEFVLIYNANRNTVQYISLSDGTVVKETEVDINTKRKMYYFTVYENEGYVEILQFKTFGEHKIIAALPLTIQ